MVLVLAEQAVWRFMNMWSHIDGIRGVIPGGEFPPNFGCWAAEVYYRIHAMLYIGAGHG